MIQRQEGDPNQVEFRIVVDAERAAVLAPALAALALEYDATVNSRHNEPQELAVVSTPETQNFRTDLATEIYEEYPDKKAWIVTKTDLHNFAVGRRFDGTLVSRAFNTIMREVTYKTCIQNSNTSEYLAKGSAVDVTDNEQTTIISGLRVDTIAKLETQLAQVDNIHGYSTRSRALLKEFVQELFTPQEQ